MCWKRLRDREILRVSAHLLHERLNILHPVVAALGAVLDLDLSHIRQALDDVVPLDVLAEGLNAAVPGVESRVVANIVAATVRPIAPEPIPRVAGVDDGRLVTFSGSEAGFRARDGNDQSRINRVLRAVGFEDRSPPGHRRRIVRIGFRREISIDRVGPGVGINGSWN